MNPEPGHIPFSRPSIEESDISEVAAVLRSGWLTTGAVTRRFESAFAEYAGAEYAVALSSCTAALHVALVALGVRAGDVVLTTTYTFAATAEVAQYVGAVPLLVDVESETLNLDLDQVRAVCEVFASDDRLGTATEMTAAGRIPPGTARVIRSLAPTARLAAIIPVHFAGLPCDMDALSAVAASHGIAVVEDAAHAVESAWKGRKIGSISDVTAFSFYATKNLSTGEGGMATTNDEQLAERMRQLSLHGISRDAWGRYAASGTWRYDIETVGFKYNSTDIASALGLAQLARINAMRERRLRIVDMYHSALRDLAGLSLPTDTTDGTHAWHLFVVRVDEESGVRRDDVIEALRSRGVGTSVHFIPLHLHTHYRTTWGYEAADFPIANRAFGQVISLPLYPTLRDSEVERVCEAVVLAVGSSC